jgi:peroxiredoxin
MAEIVSDLAPPGNGDPKGTRLKLPKVRWMLAAALFAIASVAIHYQVKIAMHQRSGSVSELRNLKVGQPAPDFTLPDLEGKPVTLSAFRSHNAVFIDFWATWCGPCRTALPGIQDLADKYKERGLAVITIDQGESRDQVRYFIERRQYSFPVLLDSDNVVGNLYGVRAIPTSVLVDKNGLVQQIFVGSLGPQKSLEQQVERAIEH